MHSDNIQTLYQSHTGHAPASVDALPGAGSNRRYFRLKGNPQLIGVSGTSFAENHAFIYISRHFAGKGLPVPHVYAVAEDGMSYLQDDLGDISLFQAISEGRQTGVFNEREKALLKETIRLLPRLQFEGADGMDFSVCYPQREFDRRSIFWDLNYFKYCFLKPSGIDFRENWLEDDFECMATVLLSDTSPTFMYRDFQSRNVMLYGGKPYFIDFQGGLKGPIFYDVASFLWQAMAHFPQELREELQHEYLDVLQHYCPMSESYFFARLRHFVLFRTLQVLGAYGFRGYFERKPHFLQSIPYAIGNLCRLLENSFDEYPYLCTVLSRLVNIPSFAMEHNRSKLTVQVTSFSYKKGIPEDPSGNGGGYVFDCRAIHNPGKYDAYKQLDGRDESVIRFLEEDGEILSFLGHVDALVDTHVQRFMERGFDHLSICFGCTGGQHRSVYSAEHVARHIHDKFGVKVQLTHRERGVTHTFDSRI